MEDEILISSPITKNNSYANFSGLNSTSNYSIIGNIKNKEMLKIKEEKIKMLNEKLKSYKRLNSDQSNQLSEQDNLIIDFNSLQKNYFELENEYNKIKHDNEQLKEALSLKDLRINEFIKLFEYSSNKFKLYNDKNNNLKIANEEYESKLKTLPDLLKKNEELNEKLNQYEKKMEGIKEEHNQKIEFYKIKYDNYETNQKHKIRQYEDEIEDLKNEIETIKTKLENSKKINDDLSEKIIEKTNEFDKKDESKQKQNDNLQNTIIQLKEKISETEIKYENENIQNKKLIDKLEEDIKNLNFDLEDREKQIVLLNEALIEFDISNRSAENELKKRESLIINLSEEKERLQRQFNDKQMDFVEFQNSTQHIIDILHKKLLSIDKEKNYLFDNQNSNINEINLLQEQLNQYKLSNNDNFEECNKIDKQYNDLYKAFQIKDSEFNEKSNQLKSVIQKRNSEKEKIKIKYEKEIQRLNLSNNELNSKITKLINSLIEIKDFAMSIEREVNETNELNNSIYSTQGLSINNNCYTTNRNSNKFNQELIKDIKNMLEKIDYNIMNNKG
jgi:chromosome segregation ATPase